MKRSKKGKSHSKPAKRRKTYCKKSKFSTDEKGREFYGNTLLTETLKAMLQNSHYIYKVECDYPLFYIYYWEEGIIKKLSFDQVCLSDLMELLGGSSMVQTGRSQAINSSYFQDYYCNDKEGYTVLMEGGMEAEVSKDFKRNFRNYIGVKPGKPPAKV
jgi:hypothetical protein